MVMKCLGDDKIGANVSELAQSSGSLSLYYLEKGNASSKTYVREQGPNIFESQYEHDRDEPYFFQSLGRIILPPKYLTELPSLPRDTLSGKHSMNDRHFGKYTGVNVILETDAHVNAVKGPFTHNLKTLLPELDKEVDRVLSEKLESALRDLKKNRQRMKETLQNEVILRRRTHDTIGGKPHVQVDLIDSLLESEKTSMRTLTSEQFANVFQLLLLAALYTTATSIVNFIPDLADRPECIQSLRQELHQFVADDHSLTDPQSLGKLSMLDSFMKESQRMSPLAWSIFLRKALKDIKLSDGMTIPAGCHVSVPTAAMAKDPASFENADQFDMMRFHRDRVALGSGTHPHLQFTGADPSAPAWGAGRWICPGRFFVEAVSKLLLSKILLRYDLGFVEGKQTRLPKILSGDRIIPNPKEEVVFYPFTPKDGA
ncbi:MAG: hypothetical protein Q9159_006448 [Coniocarpon cinnabarinum]